MATKLRREDLSKRERAAEEPRIVIKMSLQEIDSSAMHRHRRRVRQRFYANGDRASQCAFFLLDARPADRGLHPTRVASRWRSCCDVRSLLHRPANNWFRAEACQHLTNFSGAHSGGRTYRGAWFGNWRRITTYFLVVTSRQPIVVVEFFHFGMPLFAQVYSGKRFCR